MVDLEKELQSELERVLDDEELIWKQKSTKDWLMLGDRNTKYFHSQASRRSKVNRIKALRVENGEWSLEEDQIKEVVVELFKKLYTDDGLCVGCCPIQNGFLAVDSELLMGMERDLTKHEVRGALFEMAPLKAPGIDGLHVQFYQVHWDSVGDSIFDIVLTTFDKGSFEDWFNRTLIVLIPKVPIPEFVSQLIPISLCTLPYKILSKVIVNRLKPVMPIQVVKNQTSFVGGRNIIDNVVIAQEVIHSMRIRKGKRGWMALKIDMEKAYDRLRWDFIRDSLIDAKIPSILIRVIMQCVTSSSLQVLWNGGFTEEFTPSRSIRQGDPISSYLFDITMEKLGLAIRSAVLDGDWKLVALRRGGPQLSHLFFADDLVLFGEASVENAMVMKGVLDQFCSFSGHRVNVSKSMIHFSMNTNIGVQKEITRVFNF